jgi:hypothetical protein
MGAADMPELTDMPQLEAGRLLTFAHHRTFKRFDAADWSIRYRQQQAGL